MSAAKLPKGSKNPEQDWAPLDRPEDICHKGGTVVTKG